MIGLLVILVPGGIAACAGNPEMQQGHDDVTQHEILLETQQSGLEEPERRLIRDAEEWSSFWRSLPDRTGEMPEVDFTTSLVAVAAMGRRGSGGHEISVDEIESTAEETVIIVREVEPGPNCFTTQALTTPLVVARVPRREVPVRFRTIEEVRRCE